MNFTSCSQNTQGREDSIFIQALGKIEMLTDLPLVCTKLSRSFWGLAMQPSGQRGRRGRQDSGEVGGRDGREKVGEGSRGCRGSI
jgi:hypothetical protein